VEALARLFDLTTDVEEVVDAATIRPTSTSTQVACELCTAINAMTAAIWITVLIFPRIDAGMIAPSCAAATRRLDTANSRAMMTIATQADNRCRLTSAISAAVINILSAIGSITWPNVVIALRERAM
jgi:hypothetical protein